MPERVNRYGLIEIIYNKFEKRSFFFRCFFGFFLLRDEIDFDLFNFLSMIIQTY